MAEGTVWKHLVTIKPLVNFKVFTVESCQFDHRPGRNNKVVALMTEVFKIIESELIETIYNNELVVRRDFTVLTTYLMDNFQYFWVF